jgi:hypothetical protein
MLVRPHVNAHGSKLDDLKEALGKAYHALETAMRALRQCRPHARDYIPDRGLEGYDAAVAQHTARIASVAAVRQEIESLILGLDD